LTTTRSEAVLLSGALMLREGTSAIASVRGRSARAVTVGGAITPQMKLVAVNARSITIEGRGTRFDIALPDLLGRPGTVYVR